MSAMEIRKILVGLDLSPRADLVLEAAVNLAQRFGAKLVLVHAVEVPFDFPSGALGLSPTMLSGTLEDTAQRDLEARARALPPGLVHKVDLQLGTGWRVVCDVARAEDVDLIVIGSHGYSGLDRVLGTTAARIVNHADRPVLVARAKGAQNT